LDDVILFADACTGPPAFRALAFEPKKPRWIGVVLIQDRI
jgi:hypothetical protein